jgi:hypothetical protein
MDEAMESRCFIPSFTQARQALPVLLTESAGGFTARCPCPVGIAKPQVRLELSVPDAILHNQALIQHGFALNMALALMKWCCLMLRHCRSPGMR